jgi:hypothetical protein
MIEKRLHLLLDELPTLLIELNMDDPDSADTSLRDLESRSPASAGVLAVLRVLSSRRSGRGELYVLLTLVGLFVYTALRAVLAVPSPAVAHCPPRPVPVDASL